MALVIYTILVAIFSGYLGWRVGSRVEADVYKYYDAIGKLASEDYQKVIGLLRKVREDL